MNMDDAYHAGFDSKDAQAVQEEAVLILTPVKNATRYLDTYFACLEKLEYPSLLLSLGILESDSVDDTYDQVARHLKLLRGRFSRVRLWRKDFKFNLPEGAARWAPAYQIPRRKVLAKARNHLLFRALREESWVLWLDVDVVEYPADLLLRLIAARRNIVHPHCVTTFGGRSFDRNAWREHGQVHMDELRGGPSLVRLDSVGGSVLLVRADLHREGLVFPAFPYGRAHPLMRNPGPWGRQMCGELETEGLALMASDMGYQCWGMPNLEVRHAQD